MAPDFRAETTDGPISFHQWLGDSWCVLFSHPKDFTPTELGYMARLKPEFEAGMAPNYPLIGDPDLKVAKLYGMLPASAQGSSATRTPADNATVRTVYVIGPDKQIKAMIFYPMSTGRNFDEVLRLIDSVQLTAKAKVATPVNWKQGEDVIIVPAVQDAEAKERFPEGWKAPLPYMRIVPPPKV
jgi:alkyl hydroperoxide reductase subunit AhpC